MADRRNHQRRARIALAFLFTFCSVAWGQTPRVIYVDDSAGPGGDGLSWETPFPDLQQALADASAGDEIWVAAGLYTPSDNDATLSFEMRSGVALYGGFSGVETSRGQRDWTTHETILSGDIARDDNGTWVSPNSGHVVVGSNTDATAILDGFTVADGHLGPSGTGAGSPLMWGSGIYIRDGSPTIRNCVIRNNLAAFANGGGMFCWDSSPTIQNCRFSGNYVHLGDGGGLADTGLSAPTIEDCVFEFNTVVGGGPPESTGGGYDHDGTLPVTVRRTRFESNVARQLYTISQTPTYGGGLQNFGSPMTVQDCVFVGNQANYGGGLLTWDAMTVENCLFVSNVAVVTPADPYPEIGGYGAGLGICSFQPDLLNVVNCTIAYNRGKKYSGLVGLSNGRMDVHNCVVWGNSGWHPEVVGTWKEQLAGFSNISYSCIPHIFEPDAPGEDPLDPANLPGVIDLDPMFAQPAGNRDLHLTAGSPCIDAAKNAVVPPGVTTDLDGLPRFVDDPTSPDTGAGLAPLVDMGAYEFGAAPPCPGDLDGDGSVSLSDLSILLANFGAASGATPEQGDIDGDGDVDLADLSILLSVFGATCA